MLASLDSQTRRLDGVALVVGNVGNELRKPGKLVPARLGIDQQGRIAAQHPLQALEHGGGVVPDLGVGG